MDCFSCVSRTALRAGVTQQHEQRPRLDHDFHLAGAQIDALDQGRQDQKLICSRLLAKSFNKLLSFAQNLLEDMRMLYVTSVAVFQDALQLAIIPEERQQSLNHGCSRFGAGNRQPEESRTSVWFNRAEI